QSRIFRASKNIYTISEGLNILFQERYPAIRKFVPLVHTFSEYPNITHLPVQGNIKVAFTGNFNQSNLDATKRLVSILGKMNDVSIHFFTPVPAALLQLRGIEINYISSIKYVSSEDYFK